MVRTRASETQYRLIMATGLYISLVTTHLFFPIFPGKNRAVRTYLKFRLARFRERLPRRVAKSVTIDRTSVASTARSRHELSVISRVSISSINFCLAPSSHVHAAGGLYRITRSLSRVHTPGCLRKLARASFFFSLSINVHSFSINPHCLYRLLHATCRLPRLVSTVKARLNEAACKNRELVVLALSPQV